MGQILRYDFKIPAKGKLDDFEFLCSKFVKSVSTALLNKKCCRVIEEEIDSDPFLIGFNGRVYKVDKDLHVGESIYNFDACGSGEDFAIGAFYALKDIKMDPRKRIEKVLEIASIFTANVRPSFTILEI